MNTPCAIQCATLESCKSVKFYAKLLVNYMINIVCISVADTTEERNLLIEEVYPKLKEYCRNKYGLEFQVNKLWFHLNLSTTVNHKVNLSIVNHSAEALELGLS